ncbi:hypothetical protein HN51_016886, partial [Arachis hypogaea]
NKAQPKWGHLKELHRVLKSMEESLTNGNVSQIDFGNSVTATVYASNKSSSCLLTNANTTTDATVSFRGRTKQFQHDLFSLAWLGKYTRQEIFYSIRFDYILF